MTFGIGKAYQHVIRRLMSQLLCLAAYHLHLGANAPGPSFTFDLLSTCAAYPPVCFIPPATSIGTYSLLQYFSITGVSQGTI